MEIQNMEMLKRKLEDQIMKKDSYDNIYETSVKIDKMITEYYNQQELVKKA